MIEHNKYSDKKIVWFPEKLKSFVAGKISPPLYVRIKPLNRCNHRCFWCVYHADLTEMHGDMDASDRIPEPKFREILRDLRDLKVKAVTYSGGGEPLMYKGIEEFLKLTLDYNIDLSIITHGQFLTDKKAELLANGKWVRVSMDYWDGKSMKASRGIKEEYFDTVITNIKNFSKIKSSSCDLEVNYIVTEQNYKHLEGISLILRESGVQNIRFSPMWCDNFLEYHATFKNEAIGIINTIRSNLENNDFKIYDSYKQVDDLNISKRLYKKCYINQVVPVIGADLNVYTCHNQAYDRKSVVGSIKEKSFKELWMSDSTQLFFDSFNCQLVCTGQCAADSKNKFINELLTAYGDNYV